MSIIEKAANRIETKKGEPKEEQVAQSAQSAPSVESEPLPLVERQQLYAREEKARQAERQEAEPQRPEPQPQSHPEQHPHHPRHLEIDLDRMQNMGLITPGSGRSVMSEDFRIIKRPLIKRAFAPRSSTDRPGNLIMITSSLPGEGKTFCSINLAMSIAMEVDHTVLLVDADVARASVLRTLGLPAHRGLMDVLLDDNVDVSDVMWRTNVSTLSILPAGTANARATELLASQSMSAMVNQLANRYPDRIIIFDSPPLLVTSEAHVLASHMGQIVMVVESETTTQHAVKESLRQIEGCSNINLLYNKSRDFADTKAYGYSYYG